MHKDIGFSKDIKNHDIEIRLNKGMQIFKK